jgi:hypothetical protein
MAKSMARSKIHGINKGMAVGADGRNPIDGKIYGWQDPKSMGSSAGASTIPKHLRPVKLNAVSFEFGAGEE